LDQQAVLVELEALGLQEALEPQAVQAELEVLDQLEALEALGL
jgi:hypothetical protein